MIRCLRLILWSFFALVCLWLTGYGLFVASVLAEIPQSPEQKTDAIVVLTGGNFRVDTGLDLFARKLAPNLFITGVHDTVTLDDLIREWKGQQKASPALAACCMELGHKALSTTENALETQDWIKTRNIHSIRLVTSPYHMPRALLEFKSLMPGLEIIPHAVMSDRLGPREEFFWHITFMEYHKWLLRKLQLSAGFR